MPKLYDFLLNGEHYDDSDYPTAKSLLFGYQKFLKFKNNFSTHPDEQFKINLSPFTLKTDTKKTNEAKKIGMDFTHLQSNERFINFNGRMNFSDHSTSLYGLHSYGKTQVGLLHLMDRFNLLNLAIEHKRAREVDFHLKVLRKYNNHLFQIGGKVESERRNYQLFYGRRIPDGKKPIDEFGIDLELDTNFYGKLGFSVLSRKYLDYQYGVEGAVDNNGKKEIGFVQIGEKTEVGCKFVFGENGLLDMAGFGINFPMKKEISRKVKVDFGVFCSIKNQGSNSFSFNLNFFDK